MIFPSSTAQRTITLFYFPIGKSAPTTILMRSPLLTREIRLRNLVSLVVERWIHKSLKLDNSQCWAFLLLLGLSLSWIRHSRCQGTYFLDSQSWLAETLTHARVWLFNGPSLHRHFRVRNIMNPDAIVSGLLSTKTRNGMPPVHLSTPLWPIQIFLAVGISYQNIAILVAKFTEVQPTKPRCESIRVDPMTLVAHIYGPTLLIF